jgi:hypothetical protein
LIKPESKPLLAKSVVCENVRSPYPASAIGDRWRCLARRGQPCQKKACVAHPGEIPCTSID